MLITPVGMNEKRIHRGFMFLLKGCNGTWPPLSFSQLPALLNLAFHQAMGPLFKALREKS